MKRFAIPFFAALLCLALCVACGKQRNAIIGDWIIADSTQTIGFNIGHNGLAASIGNPEKQYLKWSLHDQTLLLGGKLYSQGHTIDFTDTLVITSLVPKKEMLVRYQEQTLRFVRP